MESASLFFSIIVPAHNEERYIEDTLAHLVALDYPKEKYEVLVIENGSSDRTYAKAKQFEKGNITVFMAHTKGVSGAKNFGIARMSAQADWVIFLDADTILQKDFLKSIAMFLSGAASNGYAVGTVAMTPFPPTLTAKLWFAFYNLGRRITRTSFALQIIRRGLLAHIRFDERLAMGEDLKLIRDAEQHGQFFYFLTSDVLTSTRRFEQQGWIKIFLYWTFVAMLPTNIQKRFTYKVVR